MQHQILSLEWKKGKNLKDSQLVDTLCLSIIACTQEYDFGCRVKDKDFVLLSGLPHNLYVTKMVTVNGLSMSKKPPQFNFYLINFKKLASWKVQREKRALNVICSNSLLNLNFFLRLSFAVISVKAVRLYTSKYKSRASITCTIWACSSIQLTDNRGASTWLS